MKRTILNAKISVRNGAIKDHKNNGHVTTPLNSFWDGLEVLIIQVDIGILATMKKAFNTPAIS